MNFARFTRISSYSERADGGAGRLGVAECSRSRSNETNILSKLTKQINGRELSGDDDTIVRRVLCVCVACVGVSFV
jgi:hypothetical protein